MSFDDGARIGPGANWFPPRRGGGRRAAGVTAGVMLALMAAAAAWWFLGPFGSLGNVVLAGDRALGCVRLVEVVDQSSSMQQYAAQRAAATQQLQQWISTNLEDTDEFAVIEFGSSAETTRSPLSVTDATTPRAADLSQLGSDTRFQTVLDELATLPRSSCRTELFVISDGEINDPLDPLRARRVLTDLGVDSVRLFNPVDDGAPATWSTSFPFSTSTGISGTDPDKMALTFGQAVAEATGQHLARA